MTATSATPWRRPDWAVGEKRSEDSREYRSGKPSEPSGATVYQYDGIDVAGRLQAGRPVIEWCIGGESGEIATPEEARRLATELLDAARDLERIQTESVSWNPVPRAIRCAQSLLASDSNDNGDRVIDTASGSCFVRQSEGDAFVTLPLSDDELSIEEARELIEQCTAVVLAAQQLRGADVLGADDGTR